MFLPDPPFFHLGSRIRIKELSILTPKKPKNGFSKKYDPGFSSRIRMLTFYPSRIPDPGVRKTPDPQHLFLVITSMRIRIRLPKMMRIPTNNTAIIPLYVSSVCSVGSPLFF
jgi:hypothetical protein